MILRCVWSLIEPFFPGRSSREDLMPVVKILAVATMGKLNKSQICSFSCEVVFNLTLIDPSLSLMIAQCRMSRKISVAD